MEVTELAPFFMQEKYQDPDGKNKYPYCDMLRNVYKINNQIVLDLFETYTIDLTQMKKLVDRVMD